jgi:hypothetical protein
MSTLCHRTRSSTSCRSCTARHSMHLAAYPPLHLTLRGQEFRPFSQRQRAIKASAMSAFVPFSPPSFLSEHTSLPSHMALPPRIPETRFRPSMPVRCLQEDENCKKMETESTVDVISVAPSAEMLYNQSDSYAMTLLLAPNNNAMLNSTVCRDGEPSIFDLAHACAVRAPNEPDCGHIFAPPNGHMTPISPGPTSTEPMAAFDPKDEVGYGTLLGASLCVHGAQNFDRKSHSPPHYSNHGMCVGPTQMDAQSDDACGNNAPKERFKKKNKRKVQVPSPLSLACTCTFRAHVSSIHAMHMSLNHRFMLLRFSSAPPSKCASCREGSADSKGRNAAIPLFVSTCTCLLVSVQAISSTPCAFYEESLSAACLRPAESLLNDLSLDDVHTP